MVFLNFRKKKDEETKTPDCACHAVGEAEKMKKDCCPDSKASICCVKVLGAGCKSCHEQYENAKTAVSNMGLSVEVEYITDLQKIVEYGVMSMPAIVVNEKVVSAGKVLKPSEVENLLRK